MSNIKILPPQIANKIAAGEVVDRPAAVVKELIENAIDADATEIKIVLEQAGKNLIQVVDNGSGMGAEDLPLAFQRHATSKIEKVADLDKILTLGFRGEALPSIASVARIEIKSCLSGENLGTEMQLENGKIIHQEKIALKSGSTVTVRNLFYNTPARRNFLRSDVTELSHINRVLKRFFLGYPEIRFDVFHNDKEIYQLAQTNIEQRLTAVLGEELYEGMVFVREDLNDIFLEGYASRPDLARGNSENQFIFLNKRAIQNRGLNHAVLQGYGNLIERSQYPQFVIFLNTPPNFVDINVHPTKMEVRFSNERAIYHMFLSAVRKAIQTENVIPSFSLNKFDSQKKEIERKFKPRNILFTRQLKPLNNFEEDESLENQLTFSYTIPSPDNEDDEDYQITSSDNLDDSVEQPGLWQMHRRYICSQIKSGLVIIDQHVAHERVLYEKFLGYLNEKRSVPSQKLLFPQTLELSLEDFLIFGEIKEWVQKIGFAFTELSGRTILIEAIPADVKVGYEGKVLLEIIDYYRDNEGSEYQPHEKIAAAFSCKNAIKSGDKLTQKEMTALVDQLFATKEPYFCPHGRPVIVTLNLEEIDRKFKRI
jgi:DNA mismatch repair protein MutL